MITFSKKELGNIIAQFDNNFIDQIIVHELQWQFENAEAETDIKALEIVIKYFGGE